VDLLWANGLDARNITIEMFPVYSGKYLSLKAVHILVAKVSLMTQRSKRRCGNDRQQSKYFYAAGFDHW
jgi:hypothetical protein